MAVSIARLPYVLQWGPLAFCGLLIVLSQPLRLMISGTGAWLRFADWLTQ
jgi:hypothetical protein